MAKLETYSVQFVDWTVFERSFRARSAAQALRLAERAYIAEGTNAFYAIDAGQEEWNADKQRLPYRLPVSANTKGGVR